jgi:hypothetical protein
MTDDIVKEINETRDEYKTFVNYLKDKYDGEEKEIMLATGWLEALDYVLMKINSLNRTSMERAADAEDPNYNAEKQMLQMQMLNCKDGHCDT